jgi:uncharacterized HAD superfamily protein
MSKFAVDIDDTLYDFNIKIREEFFKMAIEYDDKQILKGAYMPFVEWRSLTDSLGVKIAKEAIHRVHSDESILSQRPYENASLVLNEIKSNGHEILYISSRQERSKDATEKWLKINSFPDGEVKCVGGDKMPFVRSCRYLIDDRPSTIAEFVTDYSWKKWNGSGKNSEKPRVAFGLWYSYNQALTDLDNVYLAPTWFGLRYYLIKKEVIDG